MKRSISMLLCLVLVLTAMVFSGYLPEKKVNAATTDELQSEINRLDGEIKANEEKLNAIRKYLRKEGSEANELI